MSDKPSGHWGRKLLRTFERSPAALMTRQPTSAVSHNSSVRLTRSVRRRAASFKRACVDRTDQIKSRMGERQGCGTESRCGMSQLFDVEVRKYIPLLRF